MTISLKLLFAEIYQAKDQDDLRSRLVPKIGEYFAAKRAGIFFFEQLKADPKLQPVLNLALSLEHNPVARHLTERHTPVHEGLVTTPKAWKLICPRPDHWHVMAGPIIQNGSIVGIVGCTRDRLVSAFNSDNLVDLSAICLHLSVWMAKIVKEKPHHLKSDRLTDRELEIAELVALGRTNAEIGKQLWITENSVKQALKRMFRKLEVSSRVEMTTLLLETNKNKV